MTREETIKVLKASTIQQLGFAKIVVNGKALSVKEALNMAIKALEQEPRKGEWQLTDDEMFVYCPFCHETEYERPIDASWKYCPDCGARLD